MHTEELYLNLDKLHTTELGVQRIKKNLKLLTNDVVDYCQKLITSNNCKVTKHGKNWYCQIDDIVITINSYSYTIITAHIEKHLKGASYE